MAGKLMGVGAAGLTQMGVWITAVLLLSASAFGAELGQGGLAAYGVTPIQLVFLVLYFLLGFFFYSALSAGFGATVSQESEVQQFSMVLVMPQLAGLVLMPYILGNPSAWPVVLLSLFRALHSHCDVPAHVGNGGSVVATGAVGHPDGGRDLRRALDRVAHLSCRHPYVR